MKKGFTLIELMIVVTILGIFISLAVTFLVADSNEIKPKPAIEQKHNPNTSTEEKKTL